MTARIRARAVPAAQQIVQTPVEVKPEPVVPAVEEPKVIAMPEAVKPLADFRGDVKRRRQVNEAQLRLF